MDIICWLMASSHCRSVENGDVRTGLRGSETPSTRMTVPASSRPGVAAKHLTLVPAGHRSVTSAGAITTAGIFSRCSREFSSSCSSGT